MNLVYYLFFYSITILFLQRIWTYFISYLNFGEFFIFFVNTIFVGSSYYLIIIEWGWEWSILENFRPAFSLDPTDCPWVSEDGGDVVGSGRVGFLNILQFLWSESIFFFGKVMRQHRFFTYIQFISVFTASANILFQDFPNPPPSPAPASRQKIIARP